MIYFIRSGEFVKIGFCKRDPIRRLERLQIGNPIRLRLVAIMEGDMQAEKDLHVKLRRQHKRGEWFRINPAIRELIQRHSVDHDEWSRNRPERTIHGYPAHKLCESIEGIAKWDAAQAALTLSS